MLWQMQLTLLIVASMVPDILSVKWVVQEKNPKSKCNRICGFSDECERATTKCRFVTMSAKCADMGEMDEMMQSCYTENGLGDKYEEYYNDMGRYLNSPVKSFMDKLMITDRPAAENVNCCVFKKKGMVNDEGLVMMDKVAEYIIENAKYDEVLQDAVLNAKQKCPETKSCDVMSVRRCFLDECVRFLTA